MVKKRKHLMVGNRYISRRYIGNKKVFENLTDKTEVLSGEEIYTDKADDGAVVHVEVDGKSYQDGAPTPDYPIDIHSLNDFDVVSSVGGRNLLSNTSDEWRGVIVGRWGYYGDIYPLSDLNLETGDVVTFSLDIKNVPEGEAVRLRIDAGSNDLSDEIIVGSGRYSHTSQIKSNATWIRLRVFPSYFKETFPIEIKAVKLEKGNIATDWTPAPEDITENDNHPLIDKINLLLDEPLRSVGDVKDRIFRDSDGLWKVERNVDIPGVEILSQEMQDKLNNLRSFEGSNYVYTISNTDISPTLHATFKSKGWYYYYLKKQESDR